MDASSVKVKKLVSGDPTVWLVDGSAVRNQYDVDFIGGGHHYRYSWIPKNEIWLEDALDINELDFFLAHELYERFLMRYGRTYERAHAEANHLERLLREVPQAAKDVIRILFAEEKNR